MKFVRILAVLCALIALGVIAGYATSPRWLAALVQRSAGQQGYVISALKLGYPGTSATSVETFAVQLPRARITASGVQVTYSYDTLRVRRIQGLHIARIDVALTPKSPLDKTPATFEIPSDLDALWRSLPVTKVQIDALRVTATDPDFAMHGSAVLNSSVLNAHLIAERPSLAVGTTATLTLQRSGHLVIALTRPPATSSAAAHAEIDATINNAAKQLALNIDAQLPTDLLSLAAAPLGITTTAGSLAAKLHTHLPWPVPKALDTTALAQLAKTLDVQGNFALDWSGAVAKRFSNGHARAAGTAAREAGSVAVQLTAGSLFTAQLILAQPLALFGQKIAPQVELNAAQPLRIQLDPQQLALTGEIRGRLGVGVGERKMGEPNAALLANITGVRAPLQMRTGSVLGDGAVAHIQWRIDLPKTSFARFTSSGDGDLLLSGSAAKLHIAPGTKVTLQKLGDWSLATTNATSPKAFDVQLDTNSLSYATGKLALIVQMPKAKFGEQLATLDTGKLTVDALTKAADGRLLMQFTFTSQATANKQKYPFSVAGPLNLKDDQVRAALTLTLPRTGVTIPFTLNQDLAHQRGTMHVDTTFAITKPLLNATFDRWRGGYDLDSGEVKLRADLQWHAVGTATRSAATGTIATNKVIAHYADYSFKGLQLRGDWSTADLSAGLPGINVTNGNLQLKEVFVGAPVSDVTAAFNYLNGVFITPGLRASVMGGHASTSAMGYNVKSGSARFNVVADGLALDKLLALEGEDIQGTGTLDGTLPVTLTNNQPVIHGGVIKSRPPGGTIAYKNAPSIATYAQRPGLEFVISALEDFHFHTLDAGVEYGADNSMKLAVRLYGHNPKVERGREIHYNLNVSENIVDLLRSLRTASDLTDRLEQGLAR